MDTSHAIRGFLFLMRSLGALGKYKTHRKHAIKCVLRGRKLLGQTLFMCSGRCQGQPISLDKVTEVYCVTAVGKGCLSLCWGGMN